MKGQTMLAEIVIKMTGGKDCSHWSRYQAGDRHQVEVCRQANEPKTRLDKFRERLDDVDKSAFRCHGLFGGTDTLIYQLSAVDDRISSVDD